MGVHVAVRFTKSLSLRRAWIEITEDLQTLQNELVALLTESVD